MHLICRIGIDNMSLSTLPKEDIVIFDVGLQLCHIGINLLRLRREQREREEARNRRKKRIVWVRKWIMRRPQHGMYEKLMQELRCEDEASFVNFIRFPPELFQELVNTVGPIIQRKDTFFRRALPSGLKIAITLRYLATGNSYTDIHYGFRLGINSVCLAVPEVCQALLDVYADEYMACPIEENEWRKHAEDFSRRWNFPHCCGAVDGKHVAIRKPANSGSVYHNYKGFFSVVLMALVDARYRFLYATCGDYGSTSDGGVFDRTDLKQALSDNSINLPKPEPVVPGQRPLPYFIVGDEAFPLKTWLMKPLPQRGMSREQRIFNYRLSRARRVVENAFGILSARFRCLLTTMPQKPHTVTTIVLASCLLHNILITRKMRIIGDEITPDHEDAETHEAIPGTWRNIGNLEDMGSHQRSNYGTKEAKEVRQYLCNYVNSPDGRVSWQNDKI